MGLYIDFPNYSVANIQKKPQAVRISLRGIQYVVEISLNRVTQGLVFSLFNFDKSVLYVRLPITAQVSLTATVPNEYFPKDLPIVGFWSLDTDKTIVDSFMNEFKLYIGGVE